MQNKYKHTCPEWDYAVIDNTMPEFEACLCIFCSICFQKNLLWHDCGDKDVR